MQKVVAIVAFILFGSPIFCGCKAKSDFANKPWKDLGGAGQGVQYVEENIQNTSLISKGIEAEFFGFLNNGELVKDSSNDYTVKAFVGFVGDDVRNLISTKKFPVGTKGYISVDVKKWLMFKMADVVHFTIYLSSRVTEDSLHTDSVKLATTGFFKKIELVSSEKAIAKWNADNDITWKMLLEKNPMPGSIELSLKNEFVNGNYKDSIGSVLTSMFPNTQIQSALTDADMGSNNNKRILLFKFYVL